MMEQLRLFANIDTKLDGYVGDAELSDYLGLSPTSEDVQRITHIYDIHGNGWRISFRIVFDYLLVVKRFLTERKIMNFTVDWVFPVGLGVLGTLLTIYNWNFKIAPVKIKKPKSRR